MSEEWCKIQADAIRVVVDTVFNEYRTYHGVEPARLICSPVIRAGLVSYMEDMHPLNDKVGQSAAISYNGMAVLSDESVSGLTMTGPLRK